MGMTLTRSGSPIPIDGGGSPSEARTGEAEASWIGPPPLLTGFCFASTSPQDQQEDVELK